jgi:hypothetical protein
MPPLPQDQNFPSRHHAPMPDARMAQIPWLLVDGVLISPFPIRPGGPTAGEMPPFRTCSGAWWGPGLGSGSIRGMGG